MLDKVKVVDLSEWRDAPGPVTPIAPADAPELDVGSPAPRFYEEEPRSFSWKPAVVVAALFVVGVLAVAFL